MEVVYIGEYQIWEGNHGNGSETGPYGSVRAHIHTGWIPQALGSLWDASRASLKNPGFPGFSNTPITLFKKLLTFDEGTLVFLFTNNSTNRQKLRNQ